LLGIALAAAPEKANSYTENQTIPFEKYHDGWKIAKH